MIQLPATVRHCFIEAGWEPERRATVSDAVPAGHPAREILESFSGLTVVPDQEGEECAPDDLCFRDWFRENPGPDRDVQVWNRLLDTLLFRIAEVHRGHGVMHIATDGRCFVSSCIHDAFGFQGASFADAVERALLGRRLMPLLRPDQKTVRLYGEEFRADSPGVYWHR
jgi:hypothetical protein